MNDCTQLLQTQVQQAYAIQAPLQITGNGTKHFYGRTPQGAQLQVAAHTGIISYEPTELVVTARAGTPISEIEAALAQHGQMLAFEPPHFGANATLGGTLACGFSGPRRPYAGSARDFVLGIKCLTGKGEILQFGGQVIKNVAGYDAARLMVGALGTLGVILEVSLKVLPQPAEEITLVWSASIAEAITRMNHWAGQPLPLSACCFDGLRLYARLSGASANVAQARKKLGGDEIANGAAFWHDLREHRHPFFAGALPLWRLSLAPASIHLPLSGSWFIDWGGAQRWLKSDIAPDIIRTKVAAVDGHATLFRGSAAPPHDRAGDVFHPLPLALSTLTQRLKKAFDPDHILNPGRMYAVS